MYVVPPLADVQHQELGFRLAVVIDRVLAPLSSFEMFVGVNVGDREAGWTENYRCPDVACSFREILLAIAALTGAVDPIFSSKSLARTIAPVTNCRSMPPSMSVRF